MISPPRRSEPEPKIKRLSVKDHLNGVVTQNDDGRTPLGGLKRAENVMLTQDGTIRPRPSMIRYGPQPTGKVLGEIYEYKKVTGLTTETWMICMQSYGVSRSPSASLSPSSSESRSPSASVSPSSSVSPSGSRSPSASNSPSSSASLSLSPSASLSPSESASVSPSASLSPSSSVSSSLSPSASISSSLSPSGSRSPSSSISASLSPSGSRSPSASASGSPSASLSPSHSLSPSSSVSASPSAPITSYGQIFIARGEDANWTAITGKYYDDEAEARYFQIGGKVVIMNGVDNLSYFDIASAVVVPFTTLATPATPTLNADNVGGSGYNITYRISENSTVGETAASGALTVEVDTDRDFWNPPSAGGTDSVVINIPAAAVGVQSRNIYMGTVAGSEYLIASGVPATATTFTDDGTFAQDTTRLYPTVNSTAGPRVAGGTVVNGRAFLVRDADNPYYVWNGGDPGFELDFSPANGGGYSLVGNGSKDLPLVVKAFRDGKGNAQITVLCQGTNGLGKRFIMTPDSVTYGNTIISFYSIAEDNGQDGTVSKDGVISYGDSLWYPSRDGFKSTGTKPQLQNVLSTNRISNTIQPDLKTLNSNAMDKCIGLGFEGRLYWALPVSSETNSEIWVLDLERKGAWMKPWSIPADWMWLYNDNDGNTHHLVLVDDVIYDLSYSALTNDDGEAFMTNGQSGQIYFSDDKRMWVQLLQVVIVLLSAQGTTHFQITGKTEDDDVVALGEPVTHEASPDTTVAGWGEVNRDITGWGRNAWSTVNLVPESTGTATQEVLIEVDEEVQWASYSWNTTLAGVDYAISDIIYEFIETGIKDLQ